MQWDKSRYMKALLLPVAAALVGAAWAPVGSAATSTKYYEASLGDQPTEDVPVLTPSVVTVTLTNDPSSNQTFGSAQLTFPNLTSAELNVTAVPSGWTAQLVQTTAPAVLQLTSAGPAYAISPGESLDIAVQVDEPYVGSLVFTTQVKQSNDFLGHNNAFTLLGGDPSIVVYPYLSFSTQPPPDVLLSVPASNSYIYMCQPSVDPQAVTVQVDGPNNVPLDQSNVPVTITGSQGLGLYNNAAPTGTPEPVGPGGITVYTDGSGQAVFGPSTGACTYGLASNTPGNDFTLGASSFGATTSSDPFSVIQYKLSFSQQPPADLQASLQKSVQPAYSYMCPPVAVQVESVPTTSDGTPTPIYAPGVPVTIGVSPNGTPNPGLYYGTTSVTSETVSTNSSGVAVFSGSGSCTAGFAATNLGAGYKLAASSPGAVAAADSNAFNVDQYVNTSCSGDCNTGTLKSSSTGTTADVSATNGPSDYELAGSFGQDLSLSYCSSAVGNNDVFNTSATDQPVGEITFVFPKSVVNEVPNNGTPLMPICAGANAQFPGSTNVSTTYPGEAPWQGLLENCDNLTSSTPLVMCVVSRSKQAANEQVVVYTSSLTDPMYDG